MVLVFPELDYPMIIRMHILQKQSRKLSINSRSVYPSFKKFHVGAAKFAQLEDEERSILEKIDADGNTIIIPLEGMRRRLRFNIKVNACWLHAAKAGEECDDE
jgi:hypothetical protein